MNQSIQEKHWSTVLADKILEKFPDQSVYTCAAGISPSGVVHFGNFRDVITSFGVYKALLKKDKKAKMIFSWDDFDRFRKVPAGLDESYEQYIGMPLTKVPCPDGKYASYAEKYEKEFEAAMKELGIELEYQYQSAEYASGKYDELIKSALQNRLEIADILLSFMSEKSKESNKIDPKEYREKYYPLSVYSRFSGKDNTAVIDYDGDSKITYKCFDTDKTEMIDFTKDRVVKLAWKIDWPMRWKFNSVVFEPGGHDHASPGGSYDTASVIAKKVFGIEPPVFAEYKFVGIQGLGAKMSGSKGNSISPGKLLDIYTPELLKWLYFRKNPKQTFSLAFDSEIYRQYSEFDRMAAALQKNEIVSVSDIESLNLSDIEKNDLELENMPFRQVVSFGQIVQWDLEKLKIILDALGFKYNMESVKKRLPKAKMWLETYNPEELIVLRKTVNQEYAETLSEQDIANVKMLAEKLSENPNMEIKELDSLVYSIPKDEKLSDKENAPLQRHFFGVVYNLLIDKDTGPRLSTFLWAVGSDKVLPLLEI